MLFLMINKTDANVSCPLECQCTIEGLNFLVDCSNQGLTELPVFEYTYVSSVVLLSFKKLIICPFSHRFTFWIFQTTKSPNFQ